MKEHVFTVPVPSACVDCGTTNEPHKAKNRCKTCYFAFHYKTNKHVDKSTELVKSPV